MLMAWLIPPRYHPDSLLSIFELFIRSDYGHRYIILNFIEQQRFMIIACSDADPHVLAEGEANGIIELPEAAAS